MAKYGVFFGIDSIKKFGVVSKFNRLHTILDFEFKIMQVLYIPCKKNY